MEIKVDNLEGDEIAGLLREHLADMALHSPPESMHALDLAALKNSAVTFWSVWEEGALLGCGALKQLSLEHAEIKSMRTATTALRKGVAKRLLEYLLDESKRRGYRRLSLETGSMMAFEPARRLYRNCGFSYCDPFADYTVDANSVFMTKVL